MSFMNWSLDKEGILGSKSVLDHILYLNKTGTLISYSSYKNYLELADKLIYCSEQLNCKARIIMAKEIKKAVLEIKHEEEYKIWLKMIAPRIKTCQTIKKT
jgi:hypothetical protein